MPAPKSEARTKKILAAAQVEFLANGLRATTMQGIAKRAGVAKPTLYAYFPDKEAVFQATLAAVLDDMKAEAEKTLEGPGSAVECAAAALQNKFSRMAALLSNSPHAVELLANTEAFAEQALAEINAWLSARLVELLAGEGWPRDQATRRADLVLACVDGLFGAYAGSRIDPADVGFVVRRLLAAP
ncbi:TetR/AcrR family transcriptional regulator [Martelella sp. FLE1502]